MEQPGPLQFEVALPSLPLVRGGTVTDHRARGFFWGPPPSASALGPLAVPGVPRPLRVVREVRRPVAVSRPPLDEDVPTVLLVHALTGDAWAGGPGGWWEPLIGPGCALDPSRHRILCFNNLGGCYGSTGPLDEGFPREARLTTVDQARALWLALDALGVRRLHLVAGGSLGGMIALSLAALRPHAVDRLLPMGATAAASAWVVGFNHVQRRAIALDPSRGLSVARQVAMLSYRAEPGLDRLQGRHLPVKPGAFGERRVEGYLEHQGDRLVERFTAQSYLTFMDAMDSHDLLGGDGPALSRIRASSLVVDIDTDQLFTPAQVDELGRRLSATAHVERATLHSLHGHDAFLLEWDQLKPLVARALELPAPHGAP